MIANKMFCRYSNHLAIKQTTIIFYSVQICYNYSFHQNAPIVMTKLFKGNLRRIRRCPGELPPRTLSTNWNIIWLPMRGGRRDTSSAKIKYFIPRFYGIWYNVYIIYTYNVYIIRSRLRILVPVVKCGIGVFQIMIMASIVIIIYIAASRNRIENKHLYCVYLYYILQHLYTQLKHGM